MAQVFKMQSYRDWKVGLITTEEMLAGKTYYPEGEFSPDYQQYSVFDIFHMGERTRPKDEE